MRLAAWDEIHRCTRRAALRLGWSAAWATTLTFFRVHVGADTTHEAFLADAMETFKVTRLADAGTQEEKYVATSDASCARPACHATPADY